MVGRDESMGLRGLEGGAIHYGDVIVLADVVSGGFICGDDSGNLGVEVQTRFNPSVSAPNLADCRFLVYPKVSFTQAKSASAYLEESGLPSGVTIHNFREHAVTKRLDEAVSQRLLQYDVRLQEEGEANAAELRRWVGQPVVSGMQVMLLHANSGGYLTQLRYRSSVSALSFKVGLSGLASKASRWRFESTGKASGERLYYGLQLRIENCKFANSFLSVSRGGASCSPAASSSREPPLGFGAAPEAPPLEVNACLRSGVDFLPQAFCRFDQVRQADADGEQTGRAEEEQGEGEQRRVRGMDCVVLRSRKDPRAYLYAQPEDPTRLSWSRTSGRAEAAKGCVVTAGAMWCVQPRRVHLAGRELPAVCHDICLRHLATGKYLTFRKDSVVMQPKMLHMGTRLCLEGWSVRDEDDAGPEDGVIRNREAVWIKQDSGVRVDEMEAWISRGSSGARGKVGNSSVTLRSGQFLDNADLIEIEAISSSDEAQVLRMLRHRQQIQDGFALLACEAASSAKQAPHTIPSPRHLEASTCKSLAKSMKKHTSSQWKSMNGDEAVQMVTVREEDERAAGAAKASENEETVAGAAQMQDLTEGGTVRDQRGDKDVQIGGESEARSRADESLLSRADESHPSMNPCEGEGKSRESSSHSGREGHSVQDAGEGLLKISIELGAAAPHARQSPRLEEAPLLQSSQHLQSPPDAWKLPKGAPESSASQATVPLMVRLPRIREAHKLLLAACEALISMCEEKATRQAPDRVRWNQNLIEELGVLRHVMTSLKGLSDVFEGVEKDVTSAGKLLRDIGKACYQLIGAACKGNDANKSVMLGFVPVMNSHLTHSVGSYEAILAICSDSSDLLEALDDSTFLKSIDSLKASKLANQSHLSLIKDTCTCRDMPVTHNQDRLVKLILVKNPDLVLQVMLQGKDVILEDKSPGGIKISVTKLYEKGEGVIERQLERISGELEKPSRIGLLAYHIKMLELFKHLVHGRNQYASQVMLENATRFGVDISQLISQAQNQQLPFRLRALCCDMLRCLYIDRDPYTNIAPISKTRVWSTVVKEIDGQLRSTAVSHSGSLSDVTIWKLKEVMGKLLDTCHRKSCTMEENGLNMLAFSVIKSLSLMVNFGFYHQIDPELGELVPNKEEIKVLAPALLAILDVRKIPVNPRDTSPHLIEGTVMMRICEVLTLLGTLVDYSVNEGVTQVILFWEKQASRLFSVTDFIDSDFNDTGMPLTRVESEGDALSAAREGVSDSSQRVVQDRVQAGYREYASNPVAWKESPPWSEQELRVFAEDLADRRSIWQEFAPTELTESSKSGELPEIVRVLLHLLQFRSIHVKERVSRFLIRCYNQRTEMREVLSNIKLLCMSSEALVCFRVRLHLQEFKSLIRVIKREYTKGWQEKTGLSMQQNNGVDKSGRTQTFLRCIEIISEWRDYAHWAPSKNWLQVSKVQRMLLDLLLIEGVMEVLQIHLSLSPPSLPGGLQVAAGGYMTELINVVFEFLCDMAMWCRETQHKVMSFSDLFIAYLAVDGLEVSKLLTACCFENYEIVNAVGPEFLRLIFEELAGKYDVTSPGWLELCARLVLCRGSPVVENNLLLCGYLHGSSARNLCMMQELFEWDERVTLLETPWSEPVPPNLHHHLASIDLLTALSEGDNLGGKVYATSFLTVSDVVRNVVGCHFRLNGETPSIDSCRLHRLHFSFLSFLRTVYLQSAFDDAQFAEEMSAEDSGVWAPLPRSSGNNSLPSGIKSLMEFLLDQLKEYRFLLQFENQDAESVSPDQVCEHQFKVLVFGAIVPLLGDYFSTGSIHSAIKHSRQMIEEIFTVISDIDAISSSSMGFVVYTGAFFDPHKVAKDTLDKMSAVLKPKLDWRPRYRSMFNVKTVGVAVECTDSASAVFEKGFEAMCEDMVGLLEEMDAKNELPLVLGRDGDAPLFDQGTQTVGPSGTDKVTEMSSTTDFDSSKQILMSSEKSDLKRAASDKARTVTYAEITSAFVPMFKHCAQNEKLLVDIIEVLRASACCCRPSTVTPATPKECQELLEDMRNNRPLIINHESHFETLEWVQNRYDAIGCTVGCLRSLATSEKEQVHLHSLGFLLTLLQDGNKQVQRTIVTKLSKPTELNERFWDRIVSILSECTASLKKYKRLLKTLGSVSGVSSADQGSVHGEGEGDRAETADLWSSYTSELDRAIGRNSRSVMSLRLLQLCCVRQCTGFQDMLVKQEKNTKSHNVLRMCIALFGVVQPLIELSISAGIGTLAVFGMQLLETILDSIRGTHEVNRAELLSSDLLTCFNRVFSSTLYKPEASGSDPPAYFKDLQSPVTPNDMRCWIRWSCVRVLLALFENISSVELPLQIIGFFDVRYIISQMLDCGMVMGLTVTGTDADATGVLKVCETYIKALHRRETSFTLNSNTYKTLSKWASRHSKVKAYDLTAGAMDSIRAEAQGLWQILRHFKTFDHSLQLATVLEDFEKEHPVMCTFLHCTSMHVEVGKIKGPHNLDGGSSAQWVEMVYFPIGKNVDVVNSLPFQAMFKAEIQDIPREDSKEKGQRFVHGVERLLRHVAWFECVGSWKVTRRLLMYYKWLEKASFLVSILITVLLIFFYGIPMDPNTGHIFNDGRFASQIKRPGYDPNVPYPFAMNTSDPLGSGATLSSVMETNDDSAEYRLSLVTRWEHAAEWAFLPEIKDFIFFLGCVHSVCSLGKSVSFLVLDFPLSLFDWLQELEREVMEDRTSSLGNKRHVSPSRPFTGLKSVTLFTAKLGWRPNIRSLLTFSKVLVAPFRHSFFLCFSILGLANSPFFYPLCLMEYFAMPGGRNVVKALYIGGPALTRTFLIGMIVLVIFGVLSYSFFSTTAIEVDESCHSLYQCIAKHVLDSFRGDITTVLGTFTNWTFPALVFWEDSWEGWKTWYIMVFLVWWTFLLQPIIQGQIIDAFSRLRTEETTTRTDLNHRCFISGVSRFEFNNYPGEWETRAGGQYAWNFFLYIRHLETIEAQDRNGVEAYVIDAYQSGSGAFLPQGVFAAAQWETVRDAAADWRKSMSVLVKSLRDEIRGLEKKVGHIMMDKGDADNASDSVAVRTNVSAPSLDHQPQLRDAL